MQRRRCRNNLRHTLNDYSQSPRSALLNGAECFPGDSQVGDLDNAVAVIAAFALCIGIKPKKKGGIWIDLQTAAKIRLTIQLKAQS